MTLRRRLLVFAIALCAMGSSWAGSRERLSLDTGWLFHLGDVAGPAIKGHGMSYANGKANGSFGAAATDFDDSAWRRLDLPHDWAVEGPFDKNENASQGYRPRGIGWYRRYLQLPSTDRGRHVELQLDAIATHSTVWVNGIVANRNFSGYNGRSIDITPYLRYGDEEVNTIAVRVDANAQEGWWYEGAGMYRHTWLVKRDALHIATDGLHANPVQEGGRWTLPVTVDLASSAKVARAGVLDVALLDPEGREVARGSTRVQVQALRSATAQLKLAVPQPRLWSLAQPNVYRVRAVLKDGNAEIDRTEVQTGFRSLRFDADRGFFLNGQPVKVQGVAIHQDHAGVGVAVPDSIWEFRLRQLKSMGVNAIRFAHGAIAAEVLDMTDRMGLLVLNENRNFNTSPEVVQQQLAWLVRRDRNHPSVFMWSIFNEEPLQGSEVGYEMARRTVDVVKSLDPTRPVTAAMHDGIFGEPNVTQVLDVAGINYQTWAYDRFHQLNPKRPMTSTEDTASYMTRGAFESDAKAQVMATYDEEPSSFGTTHRKAWRAIAERSFMAGGFIWTGLDYRGEPTPYEWPSVNSFFGAMDLCGYPKTAYWIHQAHWIQDRPIIKVVPHWNWAGREGQAIKVMVATNAPRVRLLLNGQVVGESDVDPIDMVSFQVPYAPGRLEAVALRNGSELARDAVETTGALARLVLTPDRAALAGDGRDAVPVKVSVVDAQGRPVPTADMLVRFEVGGGSLIGVGNGDPNAHDSEKAPERKLFNGLAQVILQTRLGGQGALTLRATSPGLESAAVSMDVSAVAPPPATAAVEPVAKVGGWRISPPQATRPDPAIAPGHGDMNSWGWGDPPIKQAPESQPWRAYRASFSVRSDQNDGHGRLVFREIAGRAEVWMEGVKLGEKTDPAPGPLTLPLARGPGWRTLTVLVQSQPGQPSGIAGRVVIEKGTP